MSSFGWGHINVNVSNLERSVAFYQLLGFELFIPGIPYLGLSMDTASPVGSEVATILGVPVGTPGRACIMQLDDGFPKLDLTEFELPSARPPLANGDRGVVRLCLACTDLEADHARLTAAGVSFLSPPETGKDGLAEVVVCRDPDGSLVELIQVHMERWAPFLRN